MCFNADPMLDDPMLTQALNAAGMRLTIAVSDWSSMLSAFDVLGPVVDRLLDMETYVVETLLCPAHPARSSQHHARTHACTQRERERKLATHIHTHACTHRERARARLTHIHIHACTHTERESERHTYTRMHTHTKRERERESTSTHMHTCAQKSGVM